MVHHETKQKSVSVHADASCTMRSEGRLGQVWACLDEPGRFYGRGKTGPNTDFLKIEYLKSLFRPDKWVPAPLGDWSTRDEVRFGTTCSTHARHKVTCSLGRVYHALWIALGLYDLHMVHAWFTWNFWNSASPTSGSLFRASRGPQDWHKWQNFLMYLSSWMCW